MSNTGASRAAASATSSSAKPAAASRAAAASSGASASATRRSTGARVGQQSDLIAGVIDHKRQELARVRQEIKADVESIADFDREIAKLKRRMDEIRAARAKNAKRIAVFDANIEPLKQKYDAMFPQLATLFKQAKGAHSEAMTILFDEFGYHPAFKRWHDEI